MADAAVTDDDFRLILAQVREFIAKEVIPREADIARDDHVPDEIRRAAADMGLFGYAIPQEWGGLGLDLTQTSNSRWSSGTPRWRCGRCSARQTGSRGRCW